MKKLLRLLVMLRCLPALIAFFLRKRCVAPDALIVAPLKLGDFCMWLTSAPGLLDCFTNRGCRVTLLVTPELLPLARRFLRFDRAITRAYPACLYSWRETGRLRRELDGKFGIAAAVAVERSFCQDDLPCIFTRAAELHAAAAAPNSERFWRHLTMWSDRHIFRDAAVLIPDHVRTPEAANYQRLHSAMTGVEVTPRALGTADGTGTILAPFASDPARCWPLENFSAVLPLLPRPVTIVGGPADREAAQSLTGDGVANRCGETTLEELTETVAQSALVVGVDSGVANLGVMLGKKTVIASGEAHFRFLCLPETFTAFGFAMPVRVSAAESCPFAGCNYRCRRERAGAIYRCVADVSVSDFRKALETLPR